MFRIPGLEPLDPFNMNQHSSFTQRSGYVQKWEDSGYNTAIVFGSMTTNTIMQCLNTIIETLVRGDPQYDLIIKYLNRNMKCSEGRQGDGCGQVIRDFDYRSQDYEKDEHHLLL
ncbi:MAG: hypothetical protein EZS28_034054 [Streblomastix strix]|uniref:Uncharacterized protein n=1 Tax=Streblomastix strix TaxID=222440 RepID=A0A5J4UK33_9EUKA|nr:MAG: hypothetical protein EZS28_034054 [Streblomastix strix]